MSATPAAARPWLVARRGVGATLLEAALACGLLFAALVLPAPRLSPDMLRRGYLNAVPIAACWGALRLAPPRGSWRWQAFVEAATGVAITIVVWSLMLVTAGIAATYGDPASVASTDIYFAVYLVTAFVYGSMRVVVRLWAYWDNLRRRRMVWSLTHALLMAALLVASPVIVVLGFGYALSLAGGGGLTSLLASAVIWGVPMAAAALAVGVVGLLVLAPVLAVPAYVIARRTTRRLEALARTARDLRGGNLSARVEVIGEDEVAQLQCDMNAMAEDLQRAMGELAAERDRVAGLLDARRDLVAGVSHELRTPVTTLRAHLESALHGDGGPDGEGLSRDDLVVMHGEVVRLQCLIEDLFALSRAEVGRLTMRREPVDLQSVADGVANAMAPIAWDRHRVRLLTEGGGDATATADAVRVQQIMVNLVHNALRHTPPGGMVMIRVRHESARAVVEVCDTGEGIPTEDLPHVWERYYRGTGASADDGGSGLGLALVKQLAEAMGGAVEVDSTHGQGSCFRVFLPLA